jgi:hypothetical protein
VQDRVRRDSPRAPRAMFPDGGDSSQHHPAGRGLIDGGLHRVIVDEILIALVGFVQRPIEQMGSDAR